MIPRYQRHHPVAAGFHKFNPAYVWFGQRKGNQIRKRAFDTEFSFVTFSELWPCLVSWAQLDPTALKTSLS